MRLVIDILGFQHGRTYGFEEYLCNILNYFKAHIEEINADEIIIACQPMQKKYFEQKYGCCFNYVCFEGDKYIKRLWNSRRLPLRLGLTRNDVILYPGNTMPLGGSKAKKILVIHDLLFHHGEFCAKTFSVFAFRAHKYIYMPVSLKQADKVIAISNFTKKEIIHFYNTQSDKIIPIYNYFNFEKYKDGYIISIPEIDSPYILTICANYKHKNHSVMLKAFESFYKHHIDYKFVLVGTINSMAQPVYDNLPNKVKNRIIFLQHISNADIAHLYKNASMYVSASLFEGLGMPVVEAMYFNVPTIVSDIEVHLEVTMNNAEYFDPLSSESLCKMMENNIGKRNAYTGEFRQMLEEMYNEDRTSKRYVDTINSLINKVD